MRSVPMLRQAQHEEEGSASAFPFILILSLSKDEDEKQGPLRPFGPLPPEGEDFLFLDLPPLGEVPAQRG